MPSPSEIKQARLDAGLTQLEAAELVGFSARAWQMWEYGKRPMRPAVFHLFKLLAFPESIPPSASLS
jgi:transcriptional regulator with XRE-family HTH domain